MAQDKKATISRTKNEDDVVYYIARNSSGTIFARELTLEKLEMAIKTYKEPPPEKEEIPVEASSVEDSSDPEKKFLTNEQVLSSPKFRNKLAEEIQERKEKLVDDEVYGEANQEGKSKKKVSFWDKLK